MAIHKLLGIPTGRMARPGKIIEAFERSQVQQADQQLAGRLGRLPLGKQVMTLALWPFLEQILSFLVNTVDLLLATRMSVGEERVAIMDAMGLGGYMMWLMMILQGAVATGVLAIVSRSAGGRDQAQAREGLTQGLFAGLVMGVLSAFAIRISLPWLIMRFGLSDEAAHQAFSYLSILCWTCPVLGVLFAATNSLRAVGDTRTPFYVMLLINICNATLSALFVFAPEPIGQMGIAGLAWGSVLAWIIGTTVVLLLLFRTPNPESDEITLTLQGAHWHPKKEMLTRIARVGFPQGIEMLGMWMIHAYVLGFITSLPFDGALGAHFIAIRVESLSFLPGFAIGTASATLVGQYLGARNPEMAMKALLKSWHYALVFMSAMGIFFLLAPELIVRLILPESDQEASRLIGLTTPLVFLCGIFQPALATTLVLKTGLRGAGATSLVMRWSFASLISFRLIGLTIYSSFAEVTLVGVWIWMSIDIFVQATVFLMIVHRRRWLEAKV